jgi:hypothetical protein
MTATVTANWPHYRFAEIRNGRRLVRDPAASEGFSYTSDSVVFTPSGVRLMITDPEIGLYPSGTTAGRLIAQFTRSFRHLLVTLQKAFGGRLSALDDAMGIMYDLRLSVMAMTSTPDLGPGTRRNV